MPTSFYIFLFIAVASFVFAAVNMGIQVGRMFKRNADFDEAFDSFGGMFQRHLAAMVGFLIGGIGMAITGASAGMAKLQPIIDHFSKN